MISPDVTSAYKIWLDEKFCEMAKCNSSNFNYLCDKFPDLRKAKLKEGIM